jgi:hypothetical protein
MFGSAILDIAIGLVFVYLLLSLMSSAVAEGIEAFLKKRGADLYRGLKELLGDSNGSGLVKQLYEHPLLAGQFKGTYQPEVTNNLPSYIQSRVFALTLLDVALPKTAPAAPPVAGAGGAAAAPALAPAPSLRDAVSKIQNPRLQQILLPLIESAGNEYNASLTAIETWYNASMERVAGWYKRRAQVILFCIGVALAAALNADTITIIRALSRDPASRTALVTEAQAYTNAEMERLKAEGKPLTPETRFTSSISSIERLGLPLGWDKTSVQLVPQDAASWFLKVVGWILTAIAVSLGAPFWFDLLNKFISVRGSMKPKEAKPAKT